MRKMSVKLHLPPTKIMSFFLYHDRELEDEQVLIASDEHTEAFLTSQDNGYPLLIVEVDGVVKERLPVTEMLNAEPSYREILRRHFNWPNLGEDDEDDELEPDPEPDEKAKEDLLAEELEESIDEREEELFTAFMDFVNVVYDPVGGVADESADFDSCMDMCLEWMSEFLGAVYRPVKVEEMGKSYVDYFPYESAKA